MVQALKFGVGIGSTRPARWTTLDPSEERRPAVLLEDGTRIRRRAVIAATGAHHWHLGLPQWTTQPVTVVGGANSAGRAALSP